ncbi:MAG: DUF1772 domain-containing protein [Anaerolineae bacterium]|nr:DUF1772 domain-containing protein [Phycisphaerae bacterium]
MSTDHVLLILILTSALGSGLLAGVFYAFSTFVMRALARLPAREGIAAMQSINIAVINPAFLGVFLGTALICAATMVLAIVQWESPRSIYLIVGALLYIVGTFGVTMFGNVPLNNVLAKLRGDDPNASTVWTDYVRRWTIWNHVRTVAAVVAMILFIIAIGR